MATFDKPNMTRAWANNGAIVEPDSSQIDTGWIAEKPPFQTENWVQNRSDVYMQHLDERGVPEWDALVIYWEGSQCYYEKQVWHSLVDSNLGNAPIAGGGDWIPVTELNNPPGTVIAYAGSGSPAGWLICDGAEISRTTYARLFSFIGETWGAGDGSTTFELPDLVDRSILGAGNKIDVGEQIGVSSTRLLAHTHSASFSGNPLPNHTHSNFYAHPSSANDTFGTGDSSNGGFNRSVQSVSAGTPSGSVSVSSAGQTTTDLNYHPCSGMNFVIKT